MENMELFEPYIVSIGSNVNDARYKKLKKIEAIVQGDKSIAGKKLAYFNQEDMIKVIELLNMDDAEVLQNTISVISNYLDWYYIHGDDEHAENVFRDSLLLRYESLLKRVAEKTTIYSLTDIDRICNEIKWNRPYKEAVIRLTFEGVNTLKEICRITVNNVNLATGELTISKYRKIILSDRLLYCMDYTRNMTKWEALNGKSFKLEKAVENGVFGYITRNGSSDKMENRLHSCMIFMSKNIIKSNAEITTMKALYVSGIIHNLGKEYNNEEIYEFILKKNGNREKVVELDEFVKKYHYHYTGKKMKMILKPYILKMQCEELNIK